MIADSSLKYDRAVKRPLYAGHGIPELRIVHLVAGEVEVYRDPGRGRYASVSTIRRDGVLVPALLPDAVISVAALLG